MKKSLATILLVSCVYLSGCGYHQALGQFFVESSSDGYYVDVDAFGVPNSVRVSRPFKTPTEAERLANRLNADMGTDGCWYTRAR